jgi:hypothetical protein
MEERDGVTNEDENCCGEEEGEDIDGSSEEA